MCLVLEFVWLFEPETLEPAKNGGKISMAKQLTTSPTDPPGNNRST
jgi:hypothetical protein